MADQTNILNTLTYAPAGRVLGGRIIFIARLIALLYPFILLGGIYGAWLLAWARLGHPPRASWDDPSDLLGPIYIVSAIPVILFPGAAVIAIAAMVHRVLQPGPRLAAIGFCVIVSMLWLGVVMLLRVDPWGVGEWWGD